MRLSPKLKWFVSLTALACAATPAIAQVVSQPAPTIEDAQMPFKGRAAVTPEQQANEGANVMAFINTSSQSIARKLAKARDEKDVVKILCLNDKLSQIDSAGRTAADRNHSLQAAAGRHDVELANHEYTIVGIIRQRVAQLTTQANQCIGEENTFTGQTTTFTTTDPSLPPDDQNGYPPFGSVNIPGPPVEVPPPQANSPYK